MTLTAKDVAEITRLLEESSFDELTLELDGLKLSVRRNGVAAPGTRSEPDAPIPVGSQSVRSERASPGEAPSPGAGSLAGASPSVVPAAPGISDGQTLPVTAPLLGTFYRAPKPGAPPFVDVGSAVEEDTIVGIIEVMKLMNTVRAGTRGRVVEILAQDSTLVEYGETLMRVSKVTQS